MNEEEKKPDKVEDFFQRTLKNYEEDPGAALWDRIAPNIPPKPVGKPPFRYTGWMVFSAFLIGLIISGFLFRFQSNALLIEQLEQQLALSKKTVVNLEETIAQLKITVTNQTKYINETTNYETKISQESIEKSMTASTGSSPFSINSTNHLQVEKSAANETAVREKEIEPTILEQAKSSLQSLVNSRRIIGLFDTPNASSFKEKTTQLLFDNQLISHSFFAGNSDVFRLKSNSAAHAMVDFNKLPNVKIGTIDFHSANLDLTDQDRRNLRPKTNNAMSFALGKDGLTSFLAATINPVSGFKYKLNGYEPGAPAISESAEVVNSWNWSFFGGFETKTKWSIQVGLDINKLWIVNESIANIRFNANEATRVDGGYLYGFNQRTEGVLGQVIVNTNIYNQFKNDGKDVMDGDLFNLSIRTKQPVQIVRMPIMGGYRFDLSNRFYATPKIGTSVVWKIRGQTQLESVNTFSERISIQKSDIFLTTKTTTESLEAIFRTEFGYRWRPRWYLIAEPRFKYSKNALFTYNNLNIEDAPFHIMFGIRYNID